jgi:alanine dehydrogenase
VTLTTLVLTAGDVAASLDLPACIEVIEQACRLHEEQRSNGPTSLGLTLPNGSFHVKAAGLSDDGRSFIAAKANVNLPGNPTRTGLPTVQGVLVLCDGDTGIPLAVMDSMVITSVRTGATTAVAARYLARRDAETVTVVGCGEQGVVQLRAVAAVRRVRHAFAIDIDRERAGSFADRLARELDIPIEASPDLDGPLARSEICVTCTTSRRALVSADQLHPGLFIAAVGADNPEKQELDPLVLASARVVVDSLAACSAGGDLRHAIEAGVMTTADVHGELSAIVAGRLPGRTSDEQVVVFDSTGTALQDVAAAVLVYRNALASGRGASVALGSG